MGSVTDAEDVLQEVLLAAWRGLDGFEGRASPRSWLYRIATNRCLNVLRDRGRRIPPEPQPPFHADGHHPIDADQLSRTPTLVLGSSRFPSGTSDRGRCRWSRRTDPRDVESRRSRERSGGRYSMTASEPMWPAASSCEMSALGSSTSYSKAAAQKSARVGAFVLSMSNFQPKWHPASLHRVQRPVQP